MSNDNVNSIELCEACDGSTATPATDVVEVLRPDGTSTHLLVCTPCRRRIEREGARVAA